MADFGAAEFVFSRCLNARALKCKSATPGKFYLFTDNKSADTKFGQKTYYYCSESHRISPREEICRVNVLWID